MKKTIQEFKEDAQKNFDFFLGVDRVEQPKKTVVRTHKRDKRRNTPEFNKMAKKRREKAKFNAKAKKVNRKKK